jgi:hypothetical protein
MGELVNKIRKMKFKLSHDFFSVENIVLVIAIAMCLMWTYQSIEAMSRNWKLVEKLNISNKTLELTKLEVEMAQLENEYYSSDEYKELNARKFANKQLPGEQMVYLPDNTEVAKNKHAKIESEIAKTSEKEMSNFEKWMAYLLP